EEARTTDRPEQIRGDQTEGAIGAREVATARLEPVRGPAPRRFRDPGRGSLVMDDSRVGDIPARPARAARTQAVVDFFEVQEVALVERADAVDDFLANGEARARDPVARVRPVLRRMGHRGEAEEAGGDAELRPEHEL